MTNEEDASLRRILSPLAVADGGPAASLVRDRLRQRRGIRRAAPALALAAVALLAIGLRGALPEESSFRDRGLGGGIGPIHLGALADGGVPRALADGGEVRAGERVVFRLRTSSPGSAAIYEVSGGATVRVYPPSGETWAIGAGDHLIGGEDPLSWRPDVLQAGAASELIYRAVLCGEVTPTPDVPAGCASDTIRLRWTSR